MKITIHRIEVKNTHQILGYGYPVKTTAIIDIAYTADDTYRELNVGIVFDSLDKGTIERSIVSYINQHETSLTRAHEINICTRDMIGKEYNV